MSAGGDEAPGYATLDVASTPDAASKITLDEVAAFLQERYPSTLQALKFEQAKGAGVAPTEGESADDIFLSMDTDGDGVISQEEFREGMGKSRSRMSIRNSVLAQKLANGYEMIRKHDDCTSKPRLSRRLGFNGKGTVCRYEVYLWSMEK